jgi:3-methyladenine DNA glycosylase AlkD
MTARKNSPGKIASAQIKTYAPASVARGIHRILKARGDRRTAAQASVYFKPHERIRTYGVSTPEFRRIERDLYQTIRNRWTVDDAFQFCDALVRAKYMESKAVGLLLLSRYKRNFTPAHLQSAKKWLEEQLCNNWALVDTLCPTVITPLLEKFPNLIGRVKKWSGSRNLWLRRSSLVSFIPLVRRGRALDDAYEVAETLFGDREDLIHKATGWMLREAGKTDPDRLRKFLLEHGPRIPRTALRYAIERFPEAERKQILVRTKSRVG